MQQTIFSFLVLASGLAYAYSTEGDTGAVNSATLCSGLPLYTLETVNPDGTGTGLVLDVQYYGGKGSPIITWSYKEDTPKDNQLFCFVSSGYGTYFIAANYEYGGSSLVMDVEGNNPDPGARVIVWNKKHPDAANQLWHAILSSGVMKIDMPNTGLFLTPQDKGDPVLMQPEDNVNPLSQSFLLRYQGLAPN